MLLLLYSPMDLMISEIKTVIAPVINTCQSRSLKWPVRLEPISILNPRNVNRKKVLSKILIMISEKYKGIIGLAILITVISSTRINTQLTNAKMKYKFLKFFKITMKCIESIICYCNLVLLL